jgi:GrpB-like predicted nucleotidyltransferase (UPF0157 family)
VSATHPLWQPFALADLDKVETVLIGSLPPAEIEVVPYDPTWPGRFAALDALVRGALGDRVLALSHVGSTSVPGLAAKPVIDADLTVADSADEAAYLPALEAAGLVLRVREPAWQEHRLLITPDRSVHLHVFSVGADEPRRHVVFRDWLRTHPDDRAAYAALKTELAARGFTNGMDYNNHKAALVYDLYERIFAADPAHEHTPQPRPGG